MKKGEIVEGVIERIQFPNKGIMSVEDTKVIVKNTIPGQKVSCRITKKKKGRAEANVLEVLEKSTGRDSFSMSAFWNLRWL